MLRYQEEIGVVLVASTLGSVIALYWTRNDTGAIQLPANDASIGHDPFDVTTAEDVIEGYPIEEEEFWRAMRWRKTYITALFAVIVALNAASIGHALADNNVNDLNVASLQLAFSLYVLLLSANSILQDDVDSHSKSVLHLASLSLAASLLFVAAIILPDTPRPTPPPVVKVTMVVGQSLQVVAWYAIAAIYSAGCGLAFSTPTGPRLYYDPRQVYSDATVKSITNLDPENVCGLYGASPWDTLLFSYTTKVVWLGNLASSMEIGDLPILPASMRAPFNYALMRQTLQTVKPKFLGWSPRPGSGWGLVYKLCRLNRFILMVEVVLAAVAACIFYGPAFFLRQLISYLEADPAREDKVWGWVYVFGIFAANFLRHLISGQLFSLVTTTIQVRLRVQLNTVLFAKTLVRKDVASSTAPPKVDKTKGTGTTGNGEAEQVPAPNKGDNEFSSKAQVTTLMTTDVDRVSVFAWHLLSLVDCPVEIIIGTVFLYSLLGVSCFFGLMVICLFLPLNHFAGMTFVGAQENLMKARDERTSLMNEILGGIKMLKFMAWERSFEKRVMAIREKELKYQKLHYNIETLWMAIWNGSPILVTLIAFWHYAVVRQQPLTPSIAFTSIIVFSEMKFAMTGLPETLINMLQCFVSLRRIEKYLNGDEVKAVDKLQDQPKKILFKSCTVTWPQARPQASNASSATSTPRQKFVLMDLDLDFPRGELSLICGKLGSGKTLLLLALLGEADILTGQLLCPRSPPDALAQYAGQNVAKEYWIVEGLCAYVPQVAWLQNASIKDNILFNLPYDEARYKKTLEACALVTDLQIMEDGDESEIGERGVNLSGGQKARVSLARAVYSRASILFFDDVLSAVDAHTTHHLFHRCLKGELMEGRTVILVSHHVQLCATEAAYIVALDNGRAIYAGDREGFNSSGIVQKLGRIDHSDSRDDEEKLDVADQVLGHGDRSDASSTVASTSEPETKEKKPSRKLVTEETRAVGQVGKHIWLTYFEACGGPWFWAILVTFMALAASTPVFENGWLKHWSEAVLEDDRERPLFYISVYAGITGIGLVVLTVRWFILFNGSIRASTVLYKRLLEAILFADIRFHDTVSRGRLLNRFGKDFEGIDSNLAQNFALTIFTGLSAFTTIVTVSFVGGPPFIVAVLLLSILYYNSAKIYGQTSRDLRRLDSVSRSPLYSMYGETISGVPVLRAFGASSKLLRDMLRCVDTNSSPYYWMWGVNRWLSVRFNLFSAAVIGATGLACIVTPSISASSAGFALAFASTLTNNLLFMVRRFVGLEQSMIALERVKEYTDLKREAPEFIEPRPPTTWPSDGEIEVEDLAIRYAPDLPDVLHDLSFVIRSGEKVGILGRTGSGKSTLALSFFRFVEPSKGRILVDGIDISTVGLADLRSRITIIPQDPTILSGSLRTTLDVFDEYNDAEIDEALRRVHLIPAEENSDTPKTVNANVFRDLDSSVSEGGENFSTGEKQLLCMARAILKRSKVLVMDEATASVDYATDELIGKTIRHEFAQSTILTIAHRLRTVIDYDRVMLLDQGQILEFDRPAKLLEDRNSKFYALCKATGKDEFATLTKMAGVRSA